MSLLKNGKIRILLEKGIIFDEEGSYMKFQIANKARENELLFAFPKLKNSFEIYIPVLNSTLKYYTRYVKKY